MRPGTNSGSSDSGPNYKDQVKPDLLDFLFTLALTIGIAPELVDGDGLIGQDWALAVPDLAFVTNVGTFLLGVSTLLFSWYGFNASISNTPVLYGSLAGMLRFFLDAFLVVLYGFMLIVYRQLEIVVALLVLIFFLYTVWDLLKLAEYRRGPFNDKEDENQDKGFALYLLQRLWKRRSLVYFLLLLPVFLIELNRVGVAAILVVLFSLYTVWGPLKTAVSTVWAPLNLDEYRQGPFDEEEDENQEVKFVRHPVRWLWKRCLYVYVLLLLPVFLIEVLSADGNYESWKDIAIIVVLLIITTTYRFDKVEWRFYGEKEKIARVEDEKSAKEEETDNSQHLAARELK